MDARTMLTLVRGMPKKGDHGANLDGFYDIQADGYDTSREKLLHGREDLIDALDIRPGHRVLDVGGGTGRNLDFFADRLPACTSVEVLDLCQPLLAKAAERIKERGWTNVTLTHGDCCADDPATGPVDRVLFSYSLSMIPDWHRVLDRALAWLAPGGLLGVVDFYVSGYRPAPGRRRHPVVTRWFWPLWFRHAQVHLRRQLLPSLEALAEPVYLRERRGRVPLLPPWCRVPYLIYVGRKTAR